MPFLKLPPELRNIVYEHVFQDITQQRPLHPWDPLPPPPQLQAYKTLLLSNRQISNEAQSLFNKYYAANLTLYFDNIAQLQRTYKRYKESNGMPDVRFLVRAIAEGGMAVRWEPIPEDLQQLIWMQPRHDITIIPRFPYYATDLTNLSPYPRKESVDPEEHGFRRVEGGHFSCLLRGNQECMTITKLKYPQLKNGCQITVFNWPFELNTRYYSNGSIVLEGRLGDLVMSWEDEKAWYD